MAEHGLLLIKSNIKKSIKTSLAFFMLSVVTILLSYTGSQMTEGFKNLYQEKITETNSADFAAVLPYDFCEKYRVEIAAMRIMRQLTEAGLFVTLTGRNPFPR